MPTAANSACSSHLVFFLVCQSQLRLRGGRGRKAETGHLLMLFAVLLAAVFAAADDVDLLPPLH